MTDSNNAQTASAATVVPWGGHLDALAAIFREWTAANGFEEDDGDAEEIQFHPNVTRAQTEWLQAFCVIWEAEQERLDAQEADRRARATVAAPADCTAIYGNPSGPLG